MRAWCWCRNRCWVFFFFLHFFFQAEDGIRDFCLSRGLGDVYKRQVLHYDQKLGKRWSASLHGDFVRADGQYPYTLINGELETREKRRNSDIHSFHLEGNLFGDFGRGGELSFKAYYFDSERGLPGSVNLYNKNTSERLWDNNFFVQSGYKLCLIHIWRCRGIERCRSRVSQDRIRHNTLI